MKANSTAASDMRTALNSSGEVYCSACLMSTNVVPQMKVIRTSRMWAFRERDKVSVAYNIFEAKNVITIVSNF